MTNAEMFKTLYEVNRCGKYHVKIFSPNLTFLKLFIDTFEFVKHQNHNANNRNFDYPIMMANQYYADHPKLLSISYSYFLNNIHLKFWFDKDERHMFMYREESLDLFCKGHNVNFSNANKKFNMSSKDYNKEFNDNLFFELCKNFVDIV